MKVPVFVSATLLSGLLVSCAIASTWSSQPESNFGFVFEFGPCNVDKLDTFAGEFTQDRVVEPPITIPLKLTDEQMGMIYEVMVAIRIESYPEEYKIKKPLIGDFVHIAPSYYYSIQVVNGGFESSTRWVDDVVQPASEKADRLRDFFHLIIGMIKSHPNYEQLPETEFGCV
jgi:hypothetical protein